MKALAYIFFITGFMLSGCGRRTDDNSEATQKIIQIEADITAAAHIDLYNTLSTDDSKQSVQARCIILILLDGYQKRKIIFEGPPFNFTHQKNSQSDAVAEFLKLHADERRKLFADLES